MTYSKSMGGRLTKTLVQILFAFAILSCLCFGRTKVEDDKLANARFTKEGCRWVEQTLKGLSLEEKVGQLLQVRYYADYPSFDSLEYKHLRDQIWKYHVGSAVFGMHFNNSGPVRSSPLDSAKVANQLQ